MTIKRPNPWADIRDTPPNEFTKRVALDFVDEWDDDDDDDWTVVAVPVGPCRPGMYYLEFSDSDGKLGRM